MGAATSHCLVMGNPASLTAAASQGHLGRRGREGGVPWYSDHRCTSRLPILRDGEGRGQWAAWQHRGSAGETLLPIPSPARPSLLRPRTQRNPWAHASAWWRSWHRVFSGWLCNSFAQVALQV